MAAASLEASEAAQGLEQPVEGALPMAKIVLDDMKAFSQPKVGLQAEPSPAGPSHLSGAARRTWRRPSARTSPWSAAVCS